MSRRGAVIQRLAAVETMAAIDVICTDKTGTLTTNNLHLANLYGLTETFSEEDVRMCLRQFACATLDQTNRNVQALMAALGGTPVQVLDQLPVKCQNRYSAVRIRTGESDRVLVLGAAEALQPYLENDSTDWKEVWNKLLPSGQRILLFCQAVPPENEKYPA